MVWHGVSAVGQLIGDWGEQQWRGSGVLVMVAVVKNAAGMHLKDIKRNMTTNALRSNIPMGYMKVTV